MKFTVPHAGSSTRLQDIILARMKRIHHNVNRASENCSSSQAESPSREDPRGSETQYISLARERVGLARTPTHFLSMSSSEYTISAPYSAASILTGRVFTRTIGARMFLPL